MILLLLKETDFILAAMPDTFDEDALELTVPFMKTSVSALINEKHLGSMKTLSDLLKQHEVKYGIVKDGEVGRAMETSGVSNLSALIEHIDKFDKLKVQSIDKGVERASDHKYAFIQVR